MGQFLLADLKCCPACLDFTGHRSEQGQILRLSHGQDCRGARAFMHPHIWYKMGARPASVGGRARDVYTGHPEEAELHITTNKGP